MARVLNKSEEEVISAYKQEGDLAKVAGSYFSPLQKSQEDITINELMDLLNKTMLISGRGSKEKKEEILYTLFSRLKSGNEVFFLVRFLQVSILFAEK